MQNRFIKLTLVIFSLIFIFEIKAQSDNLNGAIVETLKVSEPITAMGRLGGVSMDQLGIMYVADFGEKVWKVTPAGESTIFAEGLYGSSGNAINSKGELIQSNFYGNSIIRIDRKGNSTHISEENLNGPVGITTDASNNIYVCNCTGNTITKISNKGESSIFSTSDLFNCPNGITFGPGGDLFVTNYHNDIIVKINSIGEASEFTKVLGGQGISHIVYTKENFYVTKIKANTIHRVTPKGESFLVAGSFSSQGFEDGDALTATFAHPNGIAVDPYGSDLYVNTLKGDWVINGIGKQGSIEIRKIDIKTITEIFDAVLKKDGIEAAVKSYWEYRKDSSHQHEDTGAETGTYAWQLMIQRKIPEAIRVFTLLTETYPERWRPYYYLGQVNTMIGQTDKAIEFYKTALEKNPNNPLVETKLKGLQ